jgi:nicotinate-nucleotide adenylyltransferase
LRGAARPRPPLAPPGPRGDGRRARIGLLGGSFNPAHEGHAHVARVARRALGLDQVWLMVSPGNPLKPSDGMAPFAARLASAQRQGDGRRVIATDIEARLGTRHTHRTLALLRRRFPRARFALIIGADNLAQLPRWRRWRELSRHTKLAVLPRPGYSRPALRGQAAQAMRAARVRPRALMARPGAGWSFLPAAERAISASAIRAGRQG